MSEQTYEIGGDFSYTLYTRQGVGKTYLAIVRQGNKELNRREHNNRKAIVSWAKANAHHYKYMAGRKYSTL